MLVLPRAVAGLLQSSLALEDELSLKAQLQKLLTVAKNLFTHLGWRLHWSRDEKENSNVVERMQW